MRKVIIRKPQHVNPFNEPASRLHVLNKSLAEWQSDLLRPYCDQEVVVDDFSAIPASTGETLVVSDNLWFDEAFLKTFLEEARRRGHAVRAAFRADDPAYLQQGLRALSRSYNRHGDLYFVDLWYFPGSTTERVEPVILSSDAHQVGYYHIPPVVKDQGREMAWWLPERAVCAVDTWVHLFFINIVFGMFTEAWRFEHQHAARRAFRLQARLRALFERKPLLASSAYVKVGQNCSIDPSTVFHGPVVIGDRVTIGPGCVISQCIIGNDVTLTHGNHFHMCVIGDRCFFPWGASAYFTAIMADSICGQGACVEMSVIGRGSYIGAGVIFTNFNLLPIPLRTAVDRRLIEMDMPMLGVCVGHNCRLGAGLVVYPARMIESDVVLIASPTRSVIMKNISYEESDHHAFAATDLHPRRYPREHEEELLESTW